MKYNKTWFVIVEHLIDLKFDREYMAYSAVHTTCL